MIRMRHILTIAAVATLAFASCKKKGCTDSTAQNYDVEAEKDDGSCIPMPEPEPDPRDTYLGTYTVLDSMNLLGGFDHETSYSLNVTTGGTVSDTLVLTNLWGDGGSYNCLIINESISIYSQQVSGPYYTSGNGSLANAAITYSTSGDVYEHWGTGTKD